MAESFRTLPDLPALARSLWVTVALVGLPSAGVHAGSLQLDAPAGARVTIDGRRVGAVPLPGPVPLDAGPHSVRLDMPGAHPSMAQLQVEPDDAIVHLTMRMVPKSRTNAAARSVLLAGLGQQYVERRKLGWAFTAVEAGAVAVAGIAQLSFRQSEDDFNEARASYANLLDPTALEAAQADAQQAYDDMGSAESIRNAALLVAGAAVLASVLDVWFRFPQLSLAPGSSPAGVAANLGPTPGSPLAKRAVQRDDTGIHLALRARF